MQRHIIHENLPSCRNIFDGCLTPIMLRENVVEEWEHVFKGLDAVHLQTKLTNRIFYLFRHIDLFIITKKFPCTLLKLRKHLRQFQSADLYSIELLLPVMEETIDLLLQPSIGREERTDICFLHRLQKVSTIHAQFFEDGSSNRIASADCREIFLKRHSLNVRFGHSRCAELRTIFLTVTHNEDLGFLMTFPVYHSSKERSLHDISGNRGKDLSHILLLRSRKHIDDMLNACFFLRIPIGHLFKGHEGSCNQRKRSLFQNFDRHPTYIRFCLFSARALLICFPRIQIGLRRFFMRCWNWLRHFCKLRLDLLHLRTRFSKLLLDDFSLFSRCRTQLLRECCILLFCHAYPFVYFLCHFLFHFFRCVRLRTRKSKVRKSQRTPNQYCFSHSAEADFGLIYTVLCLAKEPLSEFVESNDAHRCADDRCANNDPILCFWTQFVPTDPISPTLLCRFLRFLDTFLSSFFR